MKNLINSDIYNMIDDSSNGFITKTIHKILAGGSGGEVLNKILAKEISIMLKVYKGRATLLMVNAIKDGSLLLVRLPKEVAMPDVMPFFKYKKNGKTQTIINLTKYIAEKKNRISDEMEITIDVRKLYSLCISAYIHHSLLTNTVVLPPAVIQASANIWARMFTNILNRTIGLSTNNERYEAYNYFAMKFFMINYLDCPTVVVENITNNYIGSKQSYLITFMEEQIKLLGLTPYKSFTDFCTMLFNAEVSNIKNTRLSNSKVAMNVSSYVSAFISTYNPPALFSLAAFPYFMFTIISAYEKANICNDKRFESIFNYDKKDYPKFINGILKEL